MPLKQLNFLATKAQKFFSFIYIYIYIFIKAHNIKTKKYLGEAANFFSHEGRNIFFRYIYRIAHNIKTKKYAA